MKDLLKNRFSLDVKVTFGEMCEENEREWFSLARNEVYITWNKVLH